MWQRFNRGLYIHLSGKPPSSLEFHCPMTMVKLKAEIKLFVFVEYIRIFWPFFNPFQNFQKTRFCQPFTVDELDLEDFFCEEVRNAFASNWRDLNEDFEEFKEELLQLLLMKERVKKAASKNGFDRSSSPVTNTLFEKLFGSKYLFQLSHSKHTARNCLEDTCWRLSIRV